MSTRLRRVALGACTTIVLGAGGALLGTSPAGAQAGCTPQFTSNANSFVSRLCGMPDYDQRRTAGILQGDGRTINVNNLQIGPVNLSLALQGNGGCHCVPTSFTNLLGYYVGKGVQGNVPRAFAWDARAGYLPRPDVAPANYLNQQPYPGAEVAAYNAATLAIKTLGKDVVTGDAGCGTNWGTVLKYFNAVRPLFPKVYMSITTSSPGFAGPKQVANILAAGGTASIVYGAFSSYSETPGGAFSNTATWGSRPGGHAVTVREVRGNGPLSKSATLVVSDPASNADPAEGGDKDRYRQSATEGKSVELTRVFNPNQGIFRWRYGDVNASGNTRIWDSLLVAYPVIAVMTNGSSVQVFPGVSFNNRGVSAPSELKPKKFTVGTRSQPVLDAAFLPATGEIAYIRKGDGSVRVIGVGTRETRVLGDAPTGATQLDIDPTGGRVFVAGKNELVQFDPGSEKGDAKRMKLSSAVGAMSFDPGDGLGKGRLVVVTTDRNLRKVNPETLTQIGSAQRLSKALFEGSGPMSATVDNKGRLYLRRGATQKVGRVGLADRKVGRGTIGALKGTGGLAFGERGTIFTVIDGRIAELSPSGKAVTNSPLTGLRASGRVLQVTRSGSDIPADRANEIIDQRIIDPDFPEMAP
ncbi:hypothetical protein [Paraconexibacter sp.]|uniref:hypothetical protein n=1 Tax=Paraconexibacter sp. TaxID=2949640 RepID=UPI00356577D2